MRLVSRSPWGAHAVAGIAFIAASQLLVAAAGEPEPKSEDPYGADSPDPKEDNKGDEGSGGEDAPPEDPDGRGAATRADRAAAESLLKVGQGLMDLGQLEEACEKLQGSLDAHFIGDAAILHAQCLERRGLIASAWASYRQAASHLRQLNDERADATQLRAEQLHATVPRLTLMATSVPHMEISRGDTHFGEGVLGVALAVDPGIHLIEASAPGYEPWSGEVTIRASERKTIVIPALKKIVAPKPISKPSRAAIATTSEHGTLWTIGLISGATGVVTLGVGALLGGLASSEIKTAEADDSLCGADRLCTPAGTDKVNSADRLAIGSTVMFSVGAAAFVTGFVLALLDKPVPTEKASLWIAPSGAGLSVGGQF